MTTFQVTDEDGHSLELARLKNGRIVAPKFTNSGMERLSETPLRPDDVILASYPKSGTHWLWENIRFIMDGETTIDDKDKTEVMMERYEFGHLDSFPSPRLLNNHTYFHEQPTDLLKGDTKVVILYRNPKDVAVSYYHHLKERQNYEGRFSAFLKLLVDGFVPCALFEYFQSWDKGLKANPQIPCLFMRYEDLHREPLAERRRLAEFLGKNRDDAFLNAVTEATTIEKMREAKAGSAQVAKDGTLVMYRKGKVGDWKNHFTVSDNEWFEGVIKEKLGDLQLINFVYE